MTPQISYTITMSYNHEEAHVYDKKIQLLSHADSCGHPTTTTTMRIIMDIHTAAIASGSARVKARHTLKLRVVHHKNAAQTAGHARAKERHEHKLLRFHARINTESVVLCRPYYEERHIVGFNEFGSMDEQQHNTWDGSEVLGPSLKDVVKMANNLANSAGRVTVTVRRFPPPLQSE
jgi:hypothetical protein